jgi:hypothetical protein
VIHLLVDLLLLEVLRAEALVFSKVQPSLALGQVALLEPVDLGRQPSPQLAKLSFQGSKPFVFLERKFFRINAKFGAIFFPALIFAYVQEMVATSVTGKFLEK